MPMLNTKNSFEFIAVWATIVLILGLTLWILMDWPPLIDVWTSFLGSEAARQIERFQTLLGSIIGFGGLAFAYWLNGHQERQKAERDEDAWTRNMGHALLFETIELGAECNQNAAEISEIVSKGDATGISLDPSFSRLARLENRWLADLEPKEIARLGRNTHAALRLLRNSMRTVDQKLSVVSVGKPQSTQVNQQLSALGKSFATIALQCERMQPLLMTLTNHGVARADERDFTNVPSSEEIDERFNSLSQTADVAHSVIALRR